MKAKEIKGIWIAIDGQDTIRFWLEADGVHSQRISDSGIEHAEQTLPYEDAIDKTEGQLRL